MRGIEVGWLSAHFDGRSADNGYGSRDYRQVMAEFGNMANFDRMLEAMKARGIELIIDLVVNHTSDEHVWFANIRRSNSNRHRNYYIWRDGKPDGSPPTN